MKSTLDSLFFGEISPNFHHCDQETLQRAEDCENELLQILKGDERSLFCSYALEQSKLNAETALENFKCGFRLGSRLTLEVMQG
jgi:hypothetical protein